MKKSPDTRPGPEPASSASWRSPTAVTGLLSATVFTVAGLWFRLNSAPGLTFHDSGEFGLAAFCGGIPHPPGAPTWCSLAMLFVDLTGVESAVAGTNILSGVLAAATLGLLAALVRSWLLISRPDLPVWGNIAGSLTAVFTLAAAPAFLEQGLITEQYTLLTTLMLSLLLAATWLLQAAHVPESRASLARLGSMLGIGAGMAIGSFGAQFGRTDDTAATDPFAWLLFVVPGCALILILGRLLEGRRGADSRIWLAGWMGFLWGRACGNHLSQLVLGAVVVWALIECRRNLRRHSWRLMLMTAAGFALGLLVFVWMMMRSRVDPVLDWGDVETLDRLWWAVTRRDWAVRPLSEVPPGFLAAWLRSFQLPHQMGWPALALAAAGLVSGLKVGRRWLGWLTLTVLPYVAGIYLVHARQQGIGLDYIRQYGVADWHLPLYLGLAVLAGWGAASLLSLGLSHAPKRWIVPSATLAVLTGLLLSGTENRRNADRSGDTSGQTFVEALFASVPDRALIAVHESDHAFMMAYARYAEQTRPDTDVAYDRSGFGSFFGQGPGAGTWSQTRQRRFAQVLLGDHDLQPLRSAGFDPARSSSRPLIVDFPRDEPGAVPYLLLHGFLYETRHEIVTQDEILRAERGWQRRFGASLPAPDPRQRLQARFAWSRVYLFRSEYFNQWRMWPEAVAAAGTAVAWAPDHALAWYSLGFALMQQDETIRADEALQRAVVLDPDIAGPRTALADLALQRGDEAAARRLLAEELRRHPDDPLARTYWNYLQQLP